MAVLFVFVGAFAALAIYYFYRFFCSCCQRDGEQSFIQQRDVEEDPQIVKKLELVGMN